MASERPAEQVSNCLGDYQSPCVAERVAEQLVGQIVFVGEVLGPLFLEDPETGNAAAAFAALSTLDVEAAAADWPFVKASEAGEVAECLQMMKSGLVQGAQCADLVWEYRRLFIGPAVKPAPPWGSVYTDRDCVVFGQSALALHQWMREQGIARQTTEDVPEDHIGLMLLMLAWIASNKPECLNEYLRLHLLTWSSHYLDQLTAVANHPFYEGLARLTKHTLEGLQQHLDLQVEHPRFYR